MALLYFSPTKKPSIGNTDIESEYKVLKAQYQDGYSQRLRDGINNAPNKATWSWPAVLQDQKDYIKGFMDDRGGSEAFYFMHPGETVYRKWTCSSCKWAPISGDRFTVIAMVQEEFDLDV